MTSPHTARHVPALLLAVVIGLLGLTGVPGTASAAVSAPVPAPGELAVTVTGPGGAAVDGLLGLYVWDPDEGFVWWDEIPLAGPSPLAYEVAVDAGSWFLYFDDTASGGAGYSGGVAEAPESPTDPGVVTVTSKQGASVAIAVEAPASTVTGRVVDRAGSAVAAAVGAPGATPVTTGADGAFRLDLPAGQHGLDVRPADPDLLPRTVAVTVPATGADVALGDVVVAPVGRYAVSGTVSTSGGVPAPGAAVSLLERTTTAPTASTAWTETARTTTGATGGYLFPGVRGGRTYTVLAAVAGERPTYLGGATTPGYAAPFLADADRALPAITTLAAGTGTLRVSVSDQWGLPVPAAVSLERRGTDGTYAAVPDTGTAAPGGGVDFPSLPPGSYRASAAAPGCGAATAEVTSTTDLVVLTLRATCTKPPAPSRAPVVAGAARVGEVVQAVDAAWPAPLAGTGVTLLRDGVALPGTSHRLGAADAGTVFTAVATAQREGFTAVSAGSAPVTGAVGAAPQAATPPRVSGTPRPGSILTASPGGWFDAAGLTHSYRWTRDGAPIAGAEGATYRLTAADVGRGVGVVVTATRLGHAAGSAESVAVRVARSASTTSARPTATKVRRWRAATVQVTVTSPGRAPAGAVRVLEGTRTLASATLRAGRATVRLPRLAVGRHALTVVYAGEALVEGSQGRTSVRVTR